MANRVIEPLFGHQANADEQNELLESLVNSREGYVNALIYQEESIYQLELERLFAASQLQPNSLRRTRSRVEPQSSRSSRKKRMPRTSFKKSAALSSI